MQVAELKRTPDIPPERAVFVTDDDRRARRLRRAAFVATAIACLWLVGLGIGMLGFGSLPGASLLERNDDRADSPEPSRSLQAARVLVDLEKRAALEQNAQAAVQARNAVARSRAAAARTRVAARQARPVAPAVVTPPATTPPAQQPLNPAQRLRGWARTGETAPPGQVRRTLPPPPPGSRGQRRGQDPTVLPPPPPVPPGQLKKTPPPPPPEG